MRLPSVDVQGGWWGWLKFTIFYIFPAFFIAGLVWELVGRLALFFLRLLIGVDPLVHS